MAGELGQGAQALHPVSFGEGLRPSSGLRLKTRGEQSGLLQIGGHVSAHGAEPDEAYAHVDASCGAGVAAGVTIERCREARKRPAAVRRAC